MPAKQDNLYDALGVPRDADEAGIKKAYRRKVKKHHPDAGGEGKEFLAVQLAYDVLSDPDRRKKYDETGDAGERSADPFARAIAEACKLIIEVIENGTSDVLEEAKAQVIHAKNGLNEGIRVNRLKEARLRKAAAKMKRKKEGENILAAAIQHQADACTKQIAFLETEIKHIENVAVILEEYDFEPEASNPLGGYIWDRSDKVPW